MFVNHRRAWCRWQPEDSLADLLELELQIVSSLVWVLAIEPNSSGKVARALNHRAR